MRRDLYANLLQWKASPNRKPLILRGARQVGKTYILKLFGNQEYSSSIYLNFEADPKLSDLFSGELTPSVIINNISIYLNIEIKTNDTLLIFDEIQESPAALNSLKYFKEQANDFHIAAAGSLLGVKLSNIKGFPVGKVNFLDLNPLSFFEFLTALHKDKLREYLSQLKELKPFPDPIHQELIHLLKIYMFIGGMPEAVLEYANNNNLLNIKKIQQEILDAYALDFAKHAPKEQLMKITTIWESIPAQLAKENKKFIFSAIKKSARGREYEEAIQWLVDAGLIYKSHNITTPKLPLIGFADKTIFKVFLLDVGLLSAMSNIPAKSVLDKNQLFSEFYGAFTENFIAQQLAINQKQLYYWTSPGSAEVDFIIEKELQIYPIEVKAGVSLKKKSLLVYGEKYNAKLLLRSSLLNLKLDNKICNFPLYLINHLDSLLELANLT